MEHPLPPDTYLGNKCYISLNESSADYAVYPLLPQLDSNNDTNFTLSMTKRNTTSTLVKHIDNNAQQTQHEPHSRSNYNDNQYNNTTNTQGTTKTTHARTQNTKSVVTETTLLPNNNTKHTKQIHTQTGHKYNTLDQSKEISTKVSNRLNAMSIPNEKAYVTKKRQNQKQRQQRLTLTDLFHTQKNKREYKLDKGTLARTNFIWE